VANLADADDRAGSDYPAVSSGHPRSLAIREDCVLPRVDTWLAELFTPERIANG
jgi:hypothetical protein